MAKQPLRRAVFLDRDGVINKTIIDQGRPFSPRAAKEFKLNRGIIGALKQIKNRDYLIIVVTNQPDIARGLLTKKELTKMHKLMKAALPIDDIYVCPHDDKHHCSCRKPKAGMFYAAAEKWSIDLRRSFMVGDSEKDMRAGRTAGCKTILMKAEYNRDIDSDYHIDNIKVLTEIIYEIITNG